MKPKFRQWDIGKIDYICSIALFFIFSFNIINQIYLGKNIIFRMHYTLPFLIGSIVLAFMDRKYLIALIFLYVGITTTIDPNNISDYSGSIFFIFSFHIIRKNWYGILIVISSILLLTIRSIEANDTIPGTLIMIVAFIIIYAIYYFVVYRKIQQPASIKFKQLTKEENRILSYMSDGLSQKEAGYELGYDKYQTNYIVKEIRKKTGYDSLYEILYRAGLKDHSTSGLNK